MLDINKLRLGCEKFQGKIAEITHSIFDQKIGCNFHSNINHNQQPHKSNMKNINFCWINCMMSVIFLCKHFFCPNFTNCGILLNIPMQQLSVYLNINQTTPFMILRSQQMVITQFEKTEVERAEALPVILETIFASIEKPVFLIQRISSLIYCFQK